MFFQFKDIPAIILLAGGVYYSLKGKKLTVAAAFTGFLCGLIIYSGAGYTGLIMLTTFFLLGTLSTGWGRKVKQLLDKPNDAVQRKSTQVLANAGTGTLCALLMLISPARADIFLLMLSAGFASATADTLSSELGMIYGQNFYNCITWRKDQKGLDGVVSLEGTLIGTAGAVVIALIYGLGTQFNYFVLIIIIAAVLGNFSDSLFGASLERRNLIHNDWVNFLSTLLAAGAALLLSLMELQ